MPVRLAALAAALLALAACDSGPDDVLGGTYAGSVTEQGLTGTVTVTIPETASGPFAITSGEASFGGVTVRLTGTGTYAPPAVTVSLASSAGLALGPLSGTVSPDGARITVADGGRTLVLTRQ